jgi:hypothetical protein
MKGFTLIKSYIFIWSFACLSLVAQDFTTGSFRFISPAPGTRFATPGHTIILRHGDPLDPATIDASLFAITGSLSGVHTGEVILARDAKTLIFKPDFPFHYDEAIQVKVSEGIQTLTGITMGLLNFSFSTMKQDNAFLKESYISWFDKEYIETMEIQSLPAPEKTSGFPPSMALPDDFPAYQVTLLNNPAPGYWFVTPHNLFHPLQLPSYSVIMDHYGTPVYYNRCDAHSLDLKIQETGHISQFITTSAGGLGIGYGNFYTYDNAMNPVDTFQMGNGYMAELHDFQLFNDGSYYLFTYDPQIIDMSQVVEGGDPAATVIGFILQELDADHDVVFEWSSWDHMAITDATPDIDLTGIFIDYCHGNAVERDNDGNILVSFRNTDEIIKISRETGEIIWRLNAFREELNDFTFINDTIKFSHQHDIRRIDNGNITIFDNGNLHYGPYSRLLQYNLDEENMTAELAWVYPAEPGPGHHFAFATGNAQWQPTGHVAVSWGITFPIVTSALIFGEVTEDHQTTFEVYGQDTNTTYRAHKYKWETDLFTLSKDTIDWGEFTGYTPEPYIIQVTNNSDESIVISGVHNRTQQFYPATNFPLNVDPGATANIIINFFPSTDGYFEDVMTILCAKGEFEMIGKQVVLMGYTLDEAVPGVIFDPADESADIILMPALKLTFDEKLYKTGGEIITNADLQDIFFLKNGGEKVSMKAWISWYDNQKTEIMIRPFDYLEANTQYSYGVTKNTVQDWTGNAITEDLFATFVTGEELGVENIIVSDFARIFPNPTKGLINLEFNSPGNKMVRIFHVNGREILKSGNLTGLNYTFNLSDQPEGVYIIRVVDMESNESAELKVIRK